MVAQMQGTYATNFPTQPVSSVLKSFQDESMLLQNESCSNAIGAALDAADYVLTTAASMEQYVQLTIPKTEDGGNFGVSIQLGAIKVMHDHSAKIEKVAEELYGYASARADALEKCKFPSKTITKSTTESSSNSTGKNAEKGDTSSTSQGQSTEQKATETSSEVKEAALRRQAVAAVDARYYSKAKLAFQASISGLLLIADYMDKNKVKIEKPKGDGGSRGYSSSMY